MKKLVVIMLMCCIAFTNDSLAKCRDIGQNNSNKLVNSSYDCNKKTLKITGFNKYGNLGTGDYGDKQDWIVVNSKINNKEIIDYFIGERVTYVLTKDNFIYATGYEVADGSFKSKRKSRISDDGKGLKRNTFINIHLYKKHKVISIHGIDGDTFEKANYNGYALELKVDRNKNYFYDRRYMLIPSDVNYDKRVLKDSFKSTGKYFIFIKKNANGSKEYLEVDKKNRYLYRYLVNDKKHIYRANYYVNGIISKREEEIKKRKSVIKYRKHHRRYGETIKYKTFRGFNKKPMKKNKYYYNSKGVLKNRKEYRFNKKYYLYSVKEYHYRKNKSFYNYISYYKRKKVYKVYRYDYNKNGKLISKKLMKKQK